MQAPRPGAREVGPEDQTFFCVRAHARAQLVTHFRHFPKADQNREQKGIQKS